MRIVDKQADVKLFLKEIKSLKRTIGFVPTMGALHEGHLFLVKQARKKNDLVVVSIFVNPTQFNNQEDLKNYPKTIENDIKLLEKSECDVLFLPSVEEIYNKQIVSENFDFEGLEHEMEGKFRTGHFNGVGTIVKTLFEIIEPTIAYFGEKDFQQLQIVKKLVAQINSPTKIEGCAIFREKDGLAMSSRNTRLTVEQRNEAPFIYKILKKVQKKFSNESIEEINNWVEKQFINHPLFGLEYFTIAEEESLKTASIIETNKKYRAFIAIFADSIRLIDNIPLRN